MKAEEVEAYKNRRRQSNFLDASYAEELRKQLHGSKSFGKVFREDAGYWNGVSTTENNLETDPDGNPIKL